MTLTRRGFLAWLNGLLAALLQLPAAVGAELSKIRGQIIGRDDPDYELWRKSMVWYLHKPARHPDKIVRAESRDDVIAAVNHARENGLKIATRATGHNPARGCLREGGLLLDTSQMREVDIDADAGTAWVEPGIRSAEFIELTDPLGLAFPAAHTDIVGLGGYLIGGGLGWNMPVWDIACRSIIAADVVLADGRVVRATTDENADLLWAVRGAGPGFFGAVVRYQLRLFPTPKAIVKSKYLVPVERLPEALEELDGLTATRERQLELLAVVGRFGASGKTPAERDLVCAVSAIAFGDSESHAMKLLEPVRQSPVPAMSVAKREEVPMSWAQLYGGNETDFTSPFRTAIHNIWTNDLVGAMTTLGARWQETPPRSPRSFFLSAWGVNPSQDDADSSFTYTGDHYLSWYLMGDEDDQVEPNHAWMDEAVEMLAPYTRGHYPNEINPGRYPDALRACFSPEKWERLGALRAQYDPDAVFHSWLGFS
ncbi:MAG: FAD-binding oxidoreductase [Chromatiales bacterium]|nr:MAG: FAD-binding oxidoreductase [Chromatiales bacterium]